MLRIQRAEDLKEDFFSRTLSDTRREEAVRAILENVRANGDKALREYSAKFDGVVLQSFEIPEETLEDALRRLEASKPALAAALTRSRDLVRDFALRQRETLRDFETELSPGLFASQKNIPVERAGLYVPAGRHPLVSTVIMTVTPAIAAGVGEVVLCTPPKSAPGGGSAPYADERIMAAARLCGVNRVFACGGAQAIAAMAYGTETIPRADVIAGPGNAFVAEAKRQVFGVAGIDMIAGPTEVFIIADGSADPVLVSADLLAQAEHDVVAKPRMATDSPDLAHAVRDEIERELAAYPSDTARRSIDGFGLIIVTKDLEEAADIANRAAPEHLELALPDAAASRLIPRLKNYGSLFVGSGAAEVLGDYAAGINHTLPTSGAARYTGGLSVRTFIKTVTALRADASKEGTRKSLEAASVLGRAEGLLFHARAAELRLKRPDGAAQG